MEEFREHRWSQSLQGLHGLPPRQERRDAAEHRRRILEAAQHLFAIHGVREVSMHQIALAAQVGQGTLYRRYTGKGDLCMDLLFTVHEQLEQDIATLLSTKTSSSALERLDSLLMRLVAFFEEQGSLLEPVAAERKEWMCDTPDHKNPPPYFWVYQLLKDLLTEAVENGELPALDVPYTADAILAVLHPMIYRFQRLERGFSQERILQGIRRIYIAGIKTPSARASDNSFATTRSTDAL